MTNAATTTLVAATLATGLLAGLFYAYSVSVMPGLARADDRTLVVTMREINRAILNGWFALSFVGAPLLTVVAAVLHVSGDGFSGDGRAALWWIVAGFVATVVTLGVTAAVSVPLNVRLDTAAIATDDDVRAARDDFEVKWVRWNVVRTVSSTLAFVALTIALVVA